VIIADELHEYQILTGARPALGLQTPVARMYPLFARHRQGGMLYRVGFVWATSGKSWYWSDWDDNQRGARSNSRREAIEQAAAWWYDVWIAAGERV
jgi:hypothetical protein